MKSVMMILTILSLIVFGMGTTVASTTTTFSDDTIYWAGWANGTGDDAIDSIGGPEFSGGEYTIDSSGNLTSMSFNYGVYNNVIKSGDLFVDTDNDSNWDYVLSTTSYNIYDIDLAISDKSSTLYETSDNYFSGTSHRDGHAVNVDETELNSSNSSVVGSFVLVDYDSTLSTDIVFSGFSLELGQQFSFGFTTNCANDVIFEAGTNPVPIPTSIFLLGAGLSGLAVLKRKRQDKKS